MEEEKGLNYPYQQSKRVSKRYIHQNQANRPYQSQFIGNASKSFSIKKQNSKIDVHSQSIKKSQSFMIKNNNPQKHFQNPQSIAFVSKRLNLSRKIQSKNIKSSPKFTSSLQNFQHLLSPSKLSRQSFFRNSSASRPLISKVQSNQHFQFLQSSPKKLLLCKKIYSQKDFQAFELSIFSDKVIISAIVLSNFNETKYYLTLNQKDTQIFHQNWKNNLSKFVDQCLSIRCGIILKRKRFLKISSNKERVQRYLKQLIEKLDPKEIKRIKKAGIQ